MLKHLLFAVSSFVVFGTVVSLECYQCKNVSDIFNCNTTITCRDDEACFWQTVQSARDTYYLGCQHKHVCRITIETHENAGIIGREIQGHTNIALAETNRRQINDLCHECCSTNLCNKDLCLHKSPKTCADDPSFECAKLNSTFAICQDIHKSKDVCPKFCNLCDYADGNWTVWSNWAPCDVTCATGTQVRIRSCTNPTPTHGGFNCTGASNQQRRCIERQCPVDGNWVSWGVWSDCDVTCSNGTTSRTRTCANPSPAYGGLSCTGDRTEYNECSQAPCPVDGKWMVWGVWSTCDVTCSNGTRTRVRTCTNPAPLYGGLVCTGYAVEDKPCIKDPCPIHGGWSIWAPWGDCSVTCDVGMERRDRACSNPHPSRLGDNCFGDAHEDRVCLLTHCSNGGWSSWHLWNICPVSCGGAVRRRYRFCDNPAPTGIGQFCTGNDEEMDMCGTLPCLGHCSSAPCHNGGMCYDGPSGYICDCGDGFTGSNCQYKDQCLSFPCNNDGTCVTIQNDFYCRCAPGHEGNTCDTGFCPHTPCKRGATCFDSHYGSKYRCLSNEIVDTGTHGDLPKDCLEIIEHPEKFTDKGDGVYKIRTWRSQTVLNVFCNMSFAQGGWTVLQRRDMNNFPVLDFNRNFSEYEYGFGNPSSEYWLGLRYASELSSFANDNYVSAEFTGSDGYVWQDVAGNVTLKDGPRYNVVVKDSRLSSYGSSSQTFTSDRFFTYDQDSQFNCAAEEDGGWWFKDDYSYCFSNDTLAFPEGDTPDVILDFFNYNGWLVSHPHNYYYNLDLDEQNRTIISTLLMFKRM